MTGRHRVGSVAYATDEAIVDMWASDLFRHFEQHVPFGPHGARRSLWDAAELARIDMTDRLVARAVAS